MFKHQHMPARALSPLRLCLMALIIVGVIGELALQAFARPHEVPRAEIVRLLGVDIAPMHRHGAQMGLSHHHDKAPSKHHDHQKCALCPLLTLTALFGFECLVFSQAAFALRLQHRSAALARAPPLLFFPRPNGRGPPAFT